jgi:hypothetical protein
LEEKRAVQLTQLTSKTTLLVVLDVLDLKDVTEEENANVMTHANATKNTGVMPVNVNNVQKERMDLSALDLENVTAMEPVLAIVFTENSTVDVLNAKENQHLALDMENVDVMEDVLATSDGLILPLSEKSAIAQLNALETVLDTENVNVESVNATHCTSLFQIALARIVLHHVLPSKCVHVMEPVLAYLGSLEKTA